jgi:hypothetical protein
MRKLALSVLVVLTIILPVQAQDATINSTARTQADEEHTKWIDYVMRSIATIKPGMTRKDLFRVFKEEGGLSTNTQRRYVYKDCPYIKVDVKFSPVGDTGMDQTPGTENPADKIVEISRPFLEYTISD